MKLTKNTTVISGSANVSDLSNYSVPKSCKSSKTKQQDTLPQDVTNSYIPNSCKNLVLRRENSVSSRISQKDDLDLPKRALQPKMVRKVRGPKISTKI